MSKLIEGCPQPDEPMRERAWTAEQVEDMATAAVIPIGSPIATMLRAYAATLRQQQEYPECSGNPMSCPENEGFGCCAKHAEQITLRQQAEHSFASPEALADWLESLHETNDDGAITGGKWEPAQVAARAIRNMGKQAEQGGRVDDSRLPELPSQFLFDQEQVLAYGKKCYQAALAQNAQGEAVRRVEDEDAEAIIEAVYGRNENQCCDYSRTGEVRAALESFVTSLNIHAERARVPDGWGLKPSKATGDMVLAGIHENLSDPGPNVFNRIWAAMFAAAPSQPEDADHE